jgi:PiT family inorganic phosphate transporter
LLIGVLVAVFVGYNIGGSSTGVAFGPAVGSRIVGKVTAAALFTGFALAGGWTIGRNVIDTMSNGIVPAAQFSPEASIGVLFFTGLSLLISNIYGVPASTSMTAVGAIVGLGLATGTLDESLMFTIVSAWIVAPLLSFFLGAAIGRYLYPHLDARLAFARIEDGLVGLDRSGRLPRPTLADRAAPRDVVGAGLVLVIACYMAFSAGASNAANAVAPLVGNGAIGVDTGILLAIGAIGLGGFTIARRTLATVGDDITELPILAALIVSTIGATVITILSQLGIPASLAVSTTSCIIGLGWGRASRAVTLAEAAAAPLAADRPEGTQLSVDALSAPPGEPGTTADPETEPAPSGPTVGELASGEAAEKVQARTAGAPEPEGVAPIGEAPPEPADTDHLFDPAATGRIVFLWVLTPTVSVVGSYLLFVAIA